MSSIAIHVRDNPFARALCRALLAAILAVLAPSAVDVHAQDLPRRPFFGAHIGPAESGGVSILALTPGAPAAEAGLQTGDRVVRADGRQIADPSTFLDALSRSKAGAEWPLRIIRDGSELEIVVDLEEFPRLTSDEYTYEYGDVTADGARRRTIMTIPESEEPIPAVLLVGGVSCYSLDVPAPQPHPYLLLRDALTRGGYATLWVEKSGMGDSEGTPCPTMDFETALAGYRAGLEALKAHPAVDSGGVFILGHSMGGLVAPILASEIDVAGLIAVETAGLPWMEYTFGNLRRQLSLKGLTRPQIDAAMRDAIRANYAVFVEEREPQEVLREHPSWGQYLALPQHVSYMRQVAAYDPSAVWLDAHAPALLVAGGADFVTDPAEHEYLAKAIERVRPESVTYTLIEDLDHFLNRVPDREASYRRSKAGQTFGAYNTDLTDVVLTWLDEAVP